VQVAPDSVKMSEHVVFSRQQLHLMVFSSINESIFNDMLDYVSKDELKL